MSILWYSHAKLFLLHLHDIQYTVVSSKNTILKRWRLPFQHLFWSFVAVKIIYIYIVSVVHCFLATFHIELSEVVRKTLQYPELYAEELEELNSKGYCFVTEIVINSSWKGLCITRELNPKGINRNREDAKKLSLKKKYWK